MTSPALPGISGLHRITLTSTLTKAVSDRLLVATLTGVGIGLMSLMMGPMFLSLADSIAEMMETLPDSFLAIAAGADMGTAPGWYTGEMYSIMAPLAVIFVGVWSASKAFAGEIEERTMGILIANPVRRVRLAVDKLVAMAVHIIVTAGLIGLGTWIGVTIAGLEVETSAIVAITVHLTLLAIFFGALAAFISIAIGRRMVAVLVVILLALVAYLWSGFVPLVDSIAGLAGLSPWHHYIGSNPLTSGMDWASAALLGILGIVVAAATVKLFERRDIPG